MEAELEPEAEEAWQGTVVGETAEPVMMEEEVVPVEAEAESELVVAGEVVPEIVEGEEGVATEPVGASETMEREVPAEGAAGEPRGWLSSLLEPRREGGVEVDAEASEAALHGVHTLRSWEYPQRRWRVADGDTVKIDEEPATTLRVVPGLYRRGNESGARHWNAALFAKRGAASMVSFALDDGTYLCADNNYNLRACLSGAYKSRRFRLDATFYAERDRFFPGSVSFHSVNYNGFYISHGLEYVLKIQDGCNEPDLHRKNACFVLETPSGSADESTGWFSWLRKSPRESGAEASEATVGEGGGVLPDGLPGGPWAESAVDPRVTEEEGGVMRLEAKLRAHDGSLKDASVKFKPGDRFYNWDGLFKKRKQSPPREELYTGPRDDGLLSTDEISGEYSGCKPFNCCTSMTVVPLGANTIEIGHSTCLFFPCAAVIGPVAGGEVRTRKPGTNAFLHWREKENVVTFLADGTIRVPREAACDQCEFWKKRPHSQKQTFREVSTKDLEGTWCVCSYCPFLPLWPLLGYCLCTTKKALDEDWYTESGCGCSLLPAFIFTPNPALDKRPRIYVNGHPTNVFHSGDIHWSPDCETAQMNYDIRYRDAGCGVAGCTCVKKLC